MPRFYHKPSATPPQVADLPLNSLRSQLYPWHPNQAGEGFEQQIQAAPLPIGMPQRMLWSRSGGQVTAGRTAEGYISARDYGDKHSGPIIDAANIPPVIMTPATFGTNNGATALQVSEPARDINRAPVARGFLPPDRYVSTTALRRFIDDGRTAQAESAISASEKRSSAMREISAVREAIAARVYGRR